VAYRFGVDASPLQSVDKPLADGVTAGMAGLPKDLLDTFWRECGAGEWGLGRDEFDNILYVEATAHNFGLDQGLPASLAQQAAFFGGLKLGDLVLARACAAGHERAWEHFVAIYQEPLARAATAISGSETIGRDLAGALYAELYGLTERDGLRRCPLNSYRGRGSLLGWLRTTLSQRHVDQYRRSYREEPLEDLDAPSVERPVQESPVALPMVAQAVELALVESEAEERFILASYFLDEKTLAQIAAVLGVHEATISRRLRRATDSVRKQVLRNLRNLGISKRAAEEALGTDPRDLELQIDLKTLMQRTQSHSFSDLEASSEIALGEASTKKAAE
jgi:RNA polymerase sigma-70 factor (ECF subfamily)